MLCEAEVRILCTACTGTQVSTGGLYVYSLLYCFLINVTSRSSVFVRFIVKSRFFRKRSSHLVLHPATCFTVWEAVITRHWFKSNCSMFHQPCAHSWVSGSPCYLFPRPSFLPPLFLSININFESCDRDANNSSISPRFNGHVAG